MQDPSSGLHHAGICGTILQVSLSLLVQSNILGSMLRLRQTSICLCDISVVSELLRSKTAIHFVESNDGI